MKKFIGLIVLAMSSMASAIMIENFESYNIGVLSSQGWVFPQGMDAEVIIGGNGTKVAQAYNNYYFQGTHGAAGSGNYVYSTGINVSSSGKAYIAAQMRPLSISGCATYTVIGTQRADGYPGALIGIEIAENPVAYDRKGRFCFESANWSTKQCSENVIMFDANNQGYIFDIAINLDIVSSSVIYATLYYRNVSLGGDWVKSTVLDHVSFDNTFGIQNNARTFIRGYIGTDIDNFRIGVGHVGVTDVKEDFESYNYGVLSTQGWVFGQGNAEIVPGANLTKVAKAYNNDYFQGTHGASGSGNYVYPTGIDVSSSGQAYFAAQMRPQCISGYATYTVIGTQRADGYPGALIGVEIASNPVAYDRNGRFCFESAYWSTKQSSENVVMFDANNQGYIFDIAVNLNIVSSTEIYATLCYRNVSLGGNWIRSTTLTNIAFNNTFGIQNDARTFIRGYIGTDIDNFRMGMGQVGVAAMKENFESYNNGVLSSQGWVFGTGNGEVITGGTIFNLSKVAQPYNYGYMQGTHGADGSGNYIYPSGIYVSRPGQAYFSAQVRPRSTGGYVPFTVIGANRYDAAYPLAYIGVDIAANPVAYDRKGRFCFASANWPSLQYSENVEMFDALSSGYVFDVAVNLDIVSSTEIYATLFYKNLSLNGDWIQSAALTNVPFDNTYGIQNSARTYMNGYVGGEIDNFQMGMGHIAEVVTGYKPFPGNMTKGVDPEAVLTWSKGCPGEEVEVYFGTGWTEVAYAATSSAEYMGLYDPDTGFDVCDYNAGGLTPGQTYFWRVDTPNSLRKSPVWSFTVNGGIVSTDTQQAEIDPTLPPVYTPIEHENHSFNTAPDLFDYNPRFTPGVVTFDENNKPYIITGQMSDGGSFTRGTVIHTLNNSGRWIGLDPYQSIKAAYPTLWVDGEWKPMDRNIVFDDAGDAYMVVQIIVNDGAHGDEPQLLLMYSRDKCWTWTCYELPDNTTWYGARLEARKGHNEIAGPPAIVNDSYGGGGNIELIVPTKSSGVLTIPSPVVMTTTPAWLTPDHSGFGNVAVTKGNYTHVIWSTMESLPGHETQAPCYAATYNRTTQTVSTPVIVGYTTSLDNHDGPVITMDSSGYLHVIIGAHAEAPFKYTKSTVANSTTGGWSAPINVGAGIQPWPGQGYTYTAFLCDANNTLHLISRWAAPSPYVHMLSYMYKTSSGSWQPDTTLVDPNRAYYMCWYHELTMDRENRLFLRYSTYCNALDRGGALGEVDAYEAKWPEEGELYLSPPGNPYNNYNTRSHDPVILIKDNQGQGGSGWRIADTADFFNRMFKDGFEKGEFTTAGWTKLDTDATVATAAKYSGTYGSKLAQTTWVERKISTVGITGIHVKYNRKTYGLDAGEYLYAEWSTNGSTWNTLESTQSTSWAAQDITCSSGADNNSGFRIRFRTNANSTSEYGYVDDVEVTGTRF